MIEINIDFSQIEQVMSPMQTAYQWVPKQIDMVFPMLGRRVVDAMKEQVLPHRYTGKLEGSITFDYNPGKKELVIGPKAKRGNYDAGLILERGTKPIRNLPWKPIAQWGAFRNRPSLAARAIWLGIRAHGVAAHPFINETLMRGDVQQALTDTADKLGTQIAAYSISGRKTLGGTISAP